MCGREVDMVRVSEWCGNGQCKKCVENVCVWRVDVNGMDVVCVWEWI